MGFLYRKFLGGQETLMEDVQRNLSYLLRAKRGAASFLPDFGLSETGFRTTEEMLTRLSAEIRENLARYEPRVELLEIEEDYDTEDGHPRLVVHCRLKSTQEPLSLVLEPRQRALMPQAAARPPEES
jgi:predicted component of type VI protein secretion system